VNNEELENLIWAHIDGELNASDQERLDSTISSSDEAAEMLRSAQAMHAAIQHSLQSKAPDVARVRLMTALAAAPAAEQPSTPIWAQKWPVAVAAAALLLAWMTGVFDTTVDDTTHSLGTPSASRSHSTSEDHVAHSGLLKMIANASQDFNKSLSTNDDASTKLNRVRLKEVLGKQDAASHQVWPQKSPCGCRMRLQQCSKKVGSRLGRPCNLPNLSRGLQLEAFRITNINGVETPHLIMTRGETEVSVYIFTKEHVEELFGCLCSSTEHAAGKKLIRGCPDCHVVVRCFDDQVLVFISRMQFTELKKLVLDV
jgi:anti-sigma factor RsiW